MSQRIAWIERTFRFDFPSGLYPEIIERLRGTPARIEDLVRGLPPEILTRRDDRGWSIQENIGHLLDLEPLFMGRLDDYDAGVETLRAADMTNRKTHEADHNDEPIESVLGGFREERTKIITRLEAMPPEDCGRTTRHPRLQQPMRLVDMMYFQAEHDDYHLARMSELRRRWTQT